VHGDSITKENPMKNLKIATAIAALAFAAMSPVALAQTTPSPSAAPQATAPQGDAMGSGMMYAQGQAPTQGQAQTQVGNGTGMMYGQGSGPNGPGISGGNGAGWMGAYVLILLVAIGGFVTWVVRRRGRGS
jgi:uncharacterized membrane protein